VYYPRSTVVRPEPEPPERSTSNSTPAPTLPRASRAGCSTPPTTNPSPAHA
jgi:hypothetical protein